MDIFLVQMAIARGKPALNRAKVQALTAALRADPNHGPGSGAHPNQGHASGKPSLVVLPELFSTGYLDTSATDAAHADFWETLAGEDILFLAALARKLGCWVAGATVEKGPAGPDGNGGFRNLSLLFAPDGTEKTRYRKIHPFSYGGEDRLFTRGNEIVTCDIGPGRIGEAAGGTEAWVVQPTICYDLRFPELYRAGSARGVHLIVVQANWPQARQLHWETLLRARAIENQAFVAGVNCTGSQDSLVYSGGSILISPKGETMAQGGGEEGLVRGHADLDLCKQWRKQFPALRDRMPADFYPH